MVPSITYSSSGITLRIMLSFPVMFGWWPQMWRTATDVAKRLGLVVGGNEEASGIVVPARGYWGLAHGALWRLLQPTGESRNADSVGASPRDGRAIEMSMEKEERGDPLVAIHTTRTVRVYAITEQEATSMDQQHFMAGAAVSFGTFFLGMFAEMWLGVFAYGMAIRECNSCCVDGVLVVWGLATAF